MVNISTIQERTKPSILFCFPYCFLQCDPEMHKGWHRKTKSVELCSLHVGTIGQNTGRLGFTWNFTVTQPPPLHEIFIKFWRNQMCLPPTNNYFLNIGNSNSCLGYPQYYYNLRAITYKDFSIFGKMPDKVSWKIFL